MSERTVTPFPGALALTLGLASACLSVAALVMLARSSQWQWALAMVALLLSAFWWLAGLFVNNPNEARVLTLFGRYAGSARGNGFHWVNPFTVRRTVSLRARTLNGDRLKVNDKSGNPVDIAAVVVWQVHDTFAATFEVEQYEDFVRIQSETAVRHLASSFHYDGDDGALTLRGSTDQVSEHLKAELADRLRRAGVAVVEARLSHLAYAPEIAHAMLQRQQAHALIAARSLLVEGAVGMVEMALHRLRDSTEVVLDDERRAAMVSNLLVVLCSERTSPVVNAGSLYT